MNATNSSPSYVETQSKSTTAERIRLFLIGTVAVVLLVSVALYNGYPTVFSDTGSYLLTGALGVAYPPFRAPGYSVFAILTSLGISAWSMVLGQSVIVVYVLYEACDYFAAGDRKLRDIWLLASAGGLAGLTSLPWLVSLLMPDVFAGVLFLSLFLLAFAADLRRIRRTLLATIAMISVSSHMSLLPIAILFVLAVVVLQFVTRWTSESLPKRTLLAWLLVPILVSALFTAALNRQLGLGFRVSPSKNDFLLARLFGDGLAGDFLRENCPKHPFVSCRYLSNLPRTQEDFLFFHPMLYRALSKHQNEEDTIVSGTIAAYPIRFATSSATETLHQFASIRTGDETRTYGGSSWNDWAIKRVFPRDLSSYLHARQFHGGLASLANGAAAVDTKIFWFTSAACILFACAGRFDQTNEFFYSAILFLVINAAVCATFAGVFDRYQNRVAWIMPFCFTAYLCGFVREWKGNQAREARAGIRDPYNPGIQSTEQDICATVGSD